MPPGPLASIPSPARSVWHLGPVPLRAQELAIVAGIIVAIVVADRRYRNAGGPRGVIADVAAWAVPAGLILAAVGELAARAHGVPWPATRTADSILGFPGAVALGTLAAWYACRRVRSPDRVKFAPVLAAAAPVDRVRQRRRPARRLVYPAGIRPPLVAAVGGRDLARAPPAQL